MKPETLVARIQSYSSSEESLQQLLAVLSKHECVVNQHCQTLLDNIDPNLHSLGYLYILWSWSYNFLNPNGDPYFVKKASVFLIECCKMQVSMVPAKFCSVCRTFKDQVMALQTPSRGIVPLRHAVDKLLPSAEYLSPVHVDFILLCLTTKHYAAVGGLLDRDIFEVDPKRTALTPTDFLLYCYYGARVCVGLKRYSRALDLMYLAIVAPAMVPNAIMVMAYKLFVVISLITSGTVPEFPKYTSTSIQRVLKGGECESYSLLVEAYASHEEKVLQECIEKHKQVYEADNLAGLVDQVLTSLIKRNILRLTHTYITLSLADIAAAVGLPSVHSVEMYILKMIEAGEIHAEINEMDGMVKFLEDPEAFDNVEMAEHLDQQMLKCTELDKKLHDIHEELMCDPDYLAKALSKDSRLDANDMGVRG